MDFKNQKSVKIITAISLTTTLLVGAATIGIAVFAMFSVRHIFGPLVIPNELYSQLSVLQDGLLRIVFAFLIFGLVASYYITKILINPLIELVKGTQELSKGKFEHRLKTSKYVEINELVKTYNQMAQNLQILYTDLETKVMERTKELENANIELKNTQSMMVHSEKMRSLGQLVAGITHEINNPINFIYGNLSHLKNYSNALFELIGVYESFENDLTEDEKQELKSLKEKIELSFIKEDLPMLIESCYEGTKRTKDIIIDLKNFSRLDEMVISRIDLVKEIDTTLNILNNKIKNRINVIKEYEENIPLIEGYGGQLNQIFMNILDNASYAIKDRGTIYIRIHKTENDVTIEFEDTGCGIPQDQLGKIFDPFFTTKPVGEGTGLGMSIGYKVIQDHNGTITVSSEEGVGTTFRIQLPVKMEK